MKVQISKLLVLTVLVLGITLISSVLLQAGTTNSCEITVQVFNSATRSVTNALGSHDYDLLTAVARATNLYNGKRVLFRNNGTEINNYSLRGELIGTGTLVTALPSVNDQVRLFVMFANYQTVWTKNSFATDDAVSTGYLPCSATAFGYLGDPVNGVNVPSSDPDRNIVIAINPYTRTTDKDSTTLRVWVKATP